MRFQQVRHTADMTSACERRGLRGFMQAVR